MKWRRETYESAKTCFGLALNCHKTKTREKIDLIQLIQELAAISPDVQRYLQARYQKQKQTAAQIAPYRIVIQEQFSFSEWGNTVSWNFTGVAKAIDDYDKSSYGDKKGLSELLVFALETAVTFAESINLQDDEFDADIAELAERCIMLFADTPNLLPSYKHRLVKVGQIGSELGFHALDETLDELTNPYR